MRKPSKAILKHIIGGTHTKSFRCNSVEKCSRNINKRRLLRKLPTNRQRLIVEERRNTKISQDNIELVNRKFSFIIGPLTNNGKVRVARHFPDYQLCIRRT